MKSQYGNDLVVTSYMEFRYYKNVNELSLNEAFDNMVLIEENAGHYGLSDVYELAINNNGEIIDSKTIIGINLYNNIIRNKNKKGE